MRLAAVTLACLSLATLATGCSTPSPRQQPSPSASAPSATVSAAPASGSAVQLSQQEKLLLASGYKPEMRNGEKVYCTRDAALGTRLVAQKTCGTPAELAAGGRQTQDDVGQTQRHENNPMYH
jgi:hypothetical protein